MINQKTPQELKIMEQSGKILGETMWELIKHLKPQVSELEIDTLAEKLILEKGGEPGFKKVEGYRHTICVSTNDVCVHGIPSNHKFKLGDIVGIDCGVYYRGFHTDMSETVCIGNASKDVNIFLQTGKKALNAGIKQAQIGNRVWDVSLAIQDIVEDKGGYAVVRSLVGHGVGRELHEEPEVPGYVHGKIKNSPVLKEGMVIAIEVIYNMGGPELILDNDGWTLRTRDGKLSGLFERTVAITRAGPQILTP
jgi:methionyl aminopeptidase